MPRKVTDNSVESINRAMQDLEEQFNFLRQNRGDMGGRRIGNASDAQDGGDYVTFRQLTRLQEHVKALSAAKPKGGRVVTSTVPPGTLPLPNHHIDFGYYFVDRLPHGDPYWGQWYDEVKGYINHYAADAFYPETVPVSQIKSEISQYMLRAAQDNKNLSLAASVSFYGIQSIRDYIDAYIDAGIDLVWPKIQRINVDDEAFNSASDAEDTIAQTMDVVSGEYNLPHPPGGYGFTLTQNQVLNTDAPQASNASFVCIEAYIDPPGSATSQVNIDSMVAFIRTAKQVIPASKKIGIVLQGYARNGIPSQGTYAWPNFNTLADLQIPVYLESYNDERVVELRVFSYGRYSGTRDVDQHGGKLAEKHKLIGAACMGGATQTLGCVQQATGGNFQNDFADLMDITQIQAVDSGICQNVGGQTYVIAGQQGAFMALAVEVFNQSYTGYHTAVHPEVAEVLQIKLVGDDTVSEDYALIASSLAVRVAGAYRQSCRPSQITDAS